MVINTNFNNADRAARRMNSISYDFKEDQGVEKDKSTHQSATTATGLAPKTKTNPPKEGEWERVQRMRKEGHPLTKGGQRRQPV